MQSALEKEVLQALLNFRAWLGRHDRAVLLGLVLSIPPVFPVPFVALALALFHYRLWQQHKLEQHEIGLIRISLLLSAINAIAAIGLAYFIFNLASTSSVDGAGYLAKIWDVLNGYLQGLLNLSPLRRHEVSI